MTRNENTDEKADGKRSRIVDKKPGRISKVFLESCGLNQLKQTSFFLQKLCNHNKPFHVKPKARNYGIISRMRRVMCEQIINRRVTTGC